MDLFSIISQFLLLWAILYIIIFLIQCISTRKKELPIHKRRNNTTSILPTTFSIIDDDSNNSNTTSVVPFEKDQWSIKLFQVKYTTQRLNRFFKRLTEFSPTFWNIWFTLGVLAATVLMVVGVLVIFFASIKILFSLSKIVFPSSPQQQQQGNYNRLVKRGMTDSSTDKDDQVFLPMIPGITLPMSHIGYYLTALTICGLFHEAGHAIAAYAQNVPIQSSGLFVMYLYPGAFVNIPDQHLQALDPFKQLRIMCAGVWHNLVLYAYTYISLAGGLKLFLLFLGWQTLEVSGGVSVVQIRDNSPLASHIPPSSIIYQLDDTVLNHNIEDWNAHLFPDTGIHDIQQGFCTAVPVEDYYGNACCQINDTFPFGQAENTSVSCFRSFESKSDKVCLPTLQVLSSTDPKRCHKDSDCSVDTDMKCVVPYTPIATGQVVRIYTRFPSWIKVDDKYNEKVFVFEGELVDIWESVKVGLLTPRFSFLPSSLPHILELLLRYISSFTLALAMLNILPAFKLDGEFALEQFLIILLRGTSTNGYSSQMTTRTVETHRFIRKIHETIVKCASVVVGFVIVGSILVGLIFSNPM